MDNHLLVNWVGQVSVRVETTCVQQYMRVRAGASVENVGLAPMRGLLVRCTHIHAVECRQVHVRGCGGVHRLRPSRGTRGPCNRVQIWREDSDAGGHPELHTVDLVDVQAVAGWAGLWRPVHAHHIWCGGGVGWGHGVWKGGKHTHGCH